MGESLCRLFELAPSGESSDADAELAKYNEYLASVIGKSKQRHNELASEAESRRRANSKDESATTTTPSAATTEEDKSRSLGDSKSSSYQRHNGSSLTNGHHYHRNQPPQQQQPQGQSFRLAFLSLVM